MHQQTPPTLEEFVIRNDDHLFNHVRGLARLIDRAEVRLVNHTSSLEMLNKALEDLKLADNQRLRPNWDQYFMQLASLAAQRSNCMKRRVGCVLVRERRVISTGYNGTPRNIKNCNEGGCRSQYIRQSNINPLLISTGARCNRGHPAGVGLSTCLCIHAEENALLEAGRERIREGSTLYCDTWAFMQAAYTFSTDVKPCSCPCLTCSIKITQVGITEVVYSQGYGMDEEVSLFAFIPYSEQFWKFRLRLCSQKEMLNSVNSPQWVIRKTFLCGFCGC